MPYLSTNYGELFYKEYGEGEPIIFINGMTMSTNSWSPFIREVSKKNKMVVIDLIDQGKSYGYEYEYTIDTQSYALKEAMDALEIEEAHLVGISYGGQVALKYILNFTKGVKSLSLINTSAYSPKHTMEMIKSWINAAETLGGTDFSYNMLRSMYSKKYYEENYSSLVKLQDYFRTKLDNDYYNKLLRTYNSSLNFNTVDELYKINAPTLIISSEKDDVIPNYFHLQLNQLIKESKLVIFKDCGHSIINEKPQEFIKILLEFIKSI